MDTSSADITNFVSQIGVGYNETALKLFKRMNLKPLCTGLKILQGNDCFSKNLRVSKEEVRGVREGGVVEILGATSSAKTELLLLTIASLILPRKHSDIDIGGEECGVVFFDNDYKFELLRLIQILEAKLNTALQKTKLNQLEVKENLIKASLQRIHIIRCKDSIEFLMSLRTLPKLLQSVGNIRVMMIDSISAFHWIDKAEDEIGRTRFKRICKAIEVLLVEHNLILFATKQILFKEQTRHQGYASPHDYLGSQWNELVQHRLLVNRVKQDGEVVAEFTIKLENSTNVYSFTIGDGGVVFE